MNKNATSPAPIANLRALRGTLVLGVIFVVLFAQRYTAFILIFVAPFFLFLAAYSVFVIACNPARRQLQAIKLVIWLGLFAVVGVIQVYRTYNSREKANEFVSIVEKYSAEHGHCPPSLDEFSIDHAELYDRLGVSWYDCDAGVAPHLAYGVPTIPFDMYTYDFKSRRWQHILG